MSNSTPVVARIVPDIPSADTKHTREKIPFRRRAARMFSTFMIGFFVVFIATMGVGGGTQSANAIPGIGNPVDDIVDQMKDLFCFGTIDNAPAPISSNSDKALIGARAPFDPPFTNKSVTAYEEYGSAGLFWSEYRPKSADDNADGQAGCVTNKFGPFIGNFIANNTFMFTRAIGSLTIGVFSWATDGNLLDSFTDPDEGPLTCVIAGCHGGKGLKQSLFLNYLAPIVMLGALWGAWNGLVKKRTTETTQGGLWMVGATAFALIFLAQPGLIAEKSNDFVNMMTTTITNSVTTATSATVGKEDMCWTSGENKGNRMAACSIYKAMIVSPWAAGQFGVPMGVPLEGDKSVNIGNRSTNDLRVVQIESQTVSATEGASGDSYDTIREADAQRWESVRDDVKGGIGKGADQASFMTWTGDQYGERVNIAFASIIASICLSILIVLISFSTIVLAIGMILLIMLAPIFLLVGVHPGFGRGIALKWLELLTGTMVKRIVLAAILALLVGMYQIILETPMPWFSQIGLIMAIGVGAIIYRKPLLETLNVINLGGTRTGIENGMDRAGKRGASTATGAAGGVVGAKMAGGGMGAVLGGAVKGGVMGSRSGSPVRAATMGSGTGRRIGSRDANERARGEAEVEKAKQKTQKDLQDRIDRDPFDPEAWAELEKWNKRNKGHQVLAPSGKDGGGVPYPQSAREAKDLDDQRRQRQNNGPQPAGGGGGPRPQPAAPPAPQGGVPTAPPTPGGPAPQGPTGGIPTTPPPAPGGSNTPGPNGTPPPSGNQPQGTGQPGSSGQPGGQQGNPPRPAGGSGNPPRPQG